MLQVHRAILILTAIWVHEWMWRVVVDRQCGFCIQNRSVHVVDLCCTSPAGHSQVTPALCRIHADVSTPVECWCSILHKIGKHWNWSEQSNIQYLCCWLSTSEMLTSFPISIRYWYIGPVLMKYKMKLNLIDFIHFINTRKAIIYGMFEHGSVIVMELNRLHMAIQAGWCEWCAWFSTGDECSRSSMHHAVPHDQRLEHGWKNGAWCVAVC